MSSQVPVDRRGCPLSVDSYKTSGPGCRSVDSAVLKIQSLKRALQSAPRMASSIRSFIAIPLPGGLARVVSGYSRVLSREFPEYRYVSQENLHITLNFLGNVPDGAIPNVCNTLRDVMRDQPQIACRLGRLGAFPKPSRPRILWLGLEEGVGELVRLHHRLGEALEALDIARERKRYRPHLTIARIRDQERWPESLTAQIEAEEPGEFNSLRSPSAFDAREVVLFSSHLSPEGPDYSAMARVALRG